MLQKSNTYYFLAVLLLFLGEKEVFAQTGNNWIFQYKAGLSFNTEPPTPYKTANFSSSSQAVISDSIGNLLLYADGENIYNNKHKILENGDNIVSDMGMFAAQQAMLLSLPTTSNIYYHFYLRWLGFRGHQTGVGLYYDYIDAEVADKYKVSLRENLIYKINSNFFIAGITTIRKEDGFWVIIKGIDSIFAFPFTKSGLGTPVKSYIHAEGSDENYPRIMSFKPSQKGDLIAECMLNMNDTIASAGLHYSTSFNLYSFDKKTGIAGRKQVIEKWDTTYHEKSNFFQNYYHDAVFSPNDSFIYVMNSDYLFNSTNWPDSRARGIWQYRRYAPDIKKSKIEISGNVSKGMAMQLAPNGKIYVIDSVKGDWLSVINYPDRPGMACGYAGAVLDLDIYGNQFGEGYTVGTVFPNVLHEYIRARFSFNVSGCRQSVLFRNESDTNVFKKFRWYFCSAQGKLIDSLDAFSPNYNFQSSGKYFVKLRGTTPKGYSAWYSDTISYKKPPTAKFTYKDTLGCQWVGVQFTNQSFADTFKSLNSETYLWDFGDGTTDTAKDPLHIFTKSGKFDVRLIYSNGFCTDTFTQQQSIEILAAPKPGFAVNDTIGCAPFTLNIKDQSSGEVEKYTYTFGNAFTSNTTNPSYTFTKPGIYWVAQKLLGKTGCITSDSVKIRIREGILPGEKPEMLRATFNENNQVEISWKKHPLAKFYSLYKQYDKNTYALLQKHSFDTAYIDSDVSLDKTTSYYITATDSCGNTSSPSFVAQPVILQAENINNQYILLQATTYSKWQNGVQEYVLEIKDNSNNFITVSNNFKEKYEDSLRIYTSPLQQCYRIKAVEAGGNKQISYSNQICARHLPQLYIPSAFSPNNDELNDRFAIYTTGIRTYKIDIYNRWGELVFSGDESSNFWDGKFKSTFCPEGEYLYTIHARSSTGDHISRTGNVMLLK